MAEETKQEHYTDTDGAAADILDEVLAGHDATEDPQIDVPEADEGAEKAEEAATEAEEETEEAATEAKAEAAADTPTETADAPEKRKGLTTGAWAGISAAALVVGLLIGTFALGGNSNAPLGKATIPETELDTVVATYTYNGTSHDITAREAILQESSLTAAQDADGNYNLPSADSALTLARNNILIEEADKRGIEVTDDDINAYAEENIGSTDFAQIAQTYGLEESFIKDSITTSCKLNKLQSAIVEEQVGKEPTAPEAPEDVDKDGDKVKKEYADYIIGIVGDEWDAEKGDWASDSGMYAQILNGYKVTAESASYNAANTAYEYASQAYSTKMSTAWTTFLNGLLGNADIQIRTLAS